VREITARSVVDLSGDTMLANYDLAWHQDSTKLFETSGDPLLSLPLRRAIVTASRPA
jgi:hypothetical protein